MSKLIPLSGKRGQGKFAVVDDIDATLISSHSWCVIAAGYAVSRISNRFVYMHRLILDANPSQEVDHVNGDPLDNRRSNLRFATSSQQKMNTRKQAKAKSIFKGVVYSQRRWQAQIHVNGAYLALGRYLTQREAAQAYNDAAIKHFGEFAKLNDLSSLTDVQDIPIAASTPKSSYRGVYWHKQVNKWHVQIMVNRRKYSLGLYDSEEAAARAYDSFTIANNLNRPLNFPG